MACIDHDPIRSFRSAPKYLSEPSVPRLLVEPVDPKYYSEQVHRTLVHATLLLGTCSCGRRTVCHEYYGIP